jgi:phosphoserine phosphatase
MPKEIPVSEQMVAARLEALLKDERLPASCAAFDADGTLWAGDVGELLLQLMVEKGRVPSDTFQKYEKVMRANAVDGCAFCVEQLRGVRLEELLAWSRELVQSGRHGPLMAPVVHLARALAERGAEVWIVSGSNAWTVQVAAEAIGLNPSRVLGVTGPNESGTFTGEVHRPVTCQHGKVEALRKATSRPLLLAAGNAEYDIELLEQAEVQLAVGPLREETALLRTAQSRGWLTLRA